MKKTLKIGVILLLIYGVNTFANDCKIMTSPIDLTKMRLGYTNWRARTLPIVSTKDYKYTSFIDAYSDFDESTVKYIKEIVCKKNKWDGVENYQIEWQQTKDTYNFVATYDVFANK